MLQVTDLRVLHGAIRAVDGLSFQVQEGQICSLIGSNGAGKTTTLKAISGLVRVSAGAIRFTDIELVGAPPETRAAMGIAHVPEGRRVFAGMTVWENLVLGGYVHARGSLDEDLESVFALFPVLNERRQQYAGTLSGGEQQMLAIGRGLMSRPRLLIMDEPTMGLAPKMVDVIVDKIAEIRSRGTTVLMVEQNAVQAIRLSDRVYVVRLGRTVFEGAGPDLGEDLLKALYLGHEI